MIGPGNGSSIARMASRSTCEPLMIWNENSLMTTALMEPAARVVTSDELALIKTTVAVGATDAELKLFLFDCARQGVHPLDRLIHFTKRSGKYTPITSIDFMRIRAAETNEYAGSDDAVFVSPHGALQPEQAQVTVWRLVQGQRCAFTATARWSEYKPEQNDFMWRKMPHTMLGKCAEALALRKGFPRQLAGLYAKEELDQANVEPVIQLREEPIRPLKEDPPVWPIRHEAVAKDDGPDLGVDLPPGTVRVTAIGPGKAGAKGEITFSDGQSYLTWETEAMQRAALCHRLQTPVTVEFKRSTSGNTRVHSLTPVVF
jgi:phage recombination protein Bet